MMERTLVKARTWSARHVHPMRRETGNADGMEPKKCRRRERREQRSGRQVHEAALHAAASGATGLGHPKDATTAECWAPERNQTKRSFRNWEEPGSRRGEGLWADG